MILLTWIKVIKNGEVFMKLTIDLFKTGFWISIVAAFINGFIAFINPSYDFTFFVRFFTFFSLIHVGYMIWNHSNLIETNNKTIALILIGGLSILYNPILVIHLGERSMWFIFNIINTIGFSGFAYIINKKAKII